MNTIHKDRIIRKLGHLDKRDIAGVEEALRNHFYVDDGVIVKVSFSNTKETIEDRLEAYIRSM